MEFPDLGKHCSEKTCRQLDFLPVTCSACKQDFCKDHASFAAHRCPFAFKKDVHVPVCPLCSCPVPVKKGELPDVVVGEHMDQDCRYNPGQHNEKIFKHRCSQQGCRRKEMLPVICEECKGSFCIRHRHPLDHDCKRGGPATDRTKMAKVKRKLGEVAEKKMKKKKVAEVDPLAAGTASGGEEVPPEVQQSRGSVAVSPLRHAVASKSEER
ncbi:AN1-type zinc finger protein 2A [Rhynchocyon petersi]